MARALIDPEGWFWLPLDDPDAESVITRRLVDLRGPGEATDSLIGSVIGYLQIAAENEDVFAMVRLYGGDLVGVLAFAECGVVPDDGFPAEEPLEPGSELDVLMRDHPAREAASLLRRMNRDEEFADSELRLFDTAAGPAVRVHAFGEADRGDVEASLMVESLLYYLPLTDLGRVLRFTVSWADMEEGPALVEEADARAATLTIA